MEKHAVGEGFFLPDFCSLPVVLAIAVLSELFAIILALADSGIHAAAWNTLALNSLFMQWAGLGGALALCATRRLLARTGNVAAGLAGYLLLLLTVGVLSLAAYAIAGRLDIPLDADRTHFILRNLAIGAIVVGLVLRYLYVTHQWRERVRAEGEARLQALQARIRPHFLFNTMNTIASLTRSDAALAERAIEDLADLFRASLGDGRQLIPLEEELELTRRYVHVEGLRLGERLRVEWRLEEVPQRALVPPLTLQPLVENAIGHGIELLTDGGTVTVTGRRHGERLELTVENPLPPTGGGNGKGHHMALANVRQRLEAHFGEQAALTARAEGEGYRVEMVIPYREEEAP